MSVRLNEFLALIAEMRSAQKAYFVGDRSSAALSRSKALERQVDAAIKESRDPTPSLFADEAANG